MLAIRRGPIACADRTGRPAGPARRSHSTAGDTATVLRGCLAGLLAKDRIEGRLGIEAGGRGDRQDGFTAIRRVGETPLHLRDSAAVDVVKERFPDVLVQQL